jgi:large conductance mechanosensitive channel
MVGAQDFSSVGFTINNSLFPIGLFINAVISFVIVALVLYFFVVLPMSNLAARLAPPAKKVCGECAMEIPAPAKRCPFCTQPVTV